MFPLLKCRLDRGPDKKDGKGNSSVYVGNLDKAMDDDGLANLFAQVGGIVSATVQRNSSDNKSKKWGYVQHICSACTPHDTVQCVSLFEGSIVDDDCYIIL